MIMISTPVGEFPVEHDAAADVRLTGSGLAASKGLHDTQSAVIVVVSMMTGADDTGAVTGDVVLCVGCEGPNDAADVCGLRLSLSVACKLDMAVLLQKECDGMVT